MKYVQQRTGIDLDTNNINLQVDSQKNVRREDKKFIPMPSGDAPMKDIPQTLCEKCGVEGHLARFCFSEGKSYSTVDVDEEEDLLYIEHLKNEEKRKRREKRKRKRKEKKKREKRRKRRRYS
eukprot:TRINITY_DN2525_c0_g1_i2.p3 TRINITY_DN2525_c0_g1~~TRINITY_DN2525_c0_g1_i2.p3  ORF type:complete len:122 (+),score=37.47 TRINITY_DN2525_c0_g1_i2:910-1275(+)